MKKSNLTDLIKESVSVLALKVEALENKLEQSYKERKLYFGVGVVVGIVLGALMTYFL